jgi:Domain of unknown function, B. Theta Gene description (DUF3871)
MDSQISSVVKDYYADISFCRSGSGDIDLWKLYNLFTSANKSSYIDTFVDRAAGSTTFVKTIVESLQQNSQFWYLN